LRKKKKRRNITTKSTMRRLRMMTRRLQMETKLMQS
jgi:hypothetical protein